VPAAMTIKMAMSIRISVRNVVPPQGRFEELS